MHLLKMHQKTVTISSKENIITLFTIFCSKEVFLMLLREEVKKIISVKIKSRKIISNVIESAHVESCLIFF